MTYGRWRCLESRKGVAAAQTDVQPTRNMPSMDYYWKGCLAPTAVDKGEDRMALTPP